MTFKTIAASALLGGAMMLGATGYAAAATMFNFSYQFHNDSGLPSGDSITGSFLGTQVGDNITGYVTDISDVSASFDGVALSSPLYVYSYTPTCPNCGDAVDYTLGNAIVSFDGLQSNFVFDNAPPDGSNHLGSIADVNYFYVIQPWINGGPGSLNVATQFHSPTSGDVEHYNGLYYADSFSLSAAPEPATWAMFLVGFGAIGWTLRGNRKSAAATA